MDIDSIDVEDMTKEEARAILEEFVADGIAFKDETGVYRLREDCKAVRQCGGEMIVTRALPQ